MRTMKGILKGHLPFGPPHTPRSPLATARPSLSRSETPRCDNARVSLVWRSPVQGNAMPSISSATNDSAPTAQSKSKSKENLFLAKLS